MAVTRSRKRRASEVAFLEVLERVAENGWLPWWSDENRNLRLVSRSTNATLDASSSAAGGGPDWAAIVDLLDDRNRFDLNYCEYCANTYWRDDRDGGEGACKTCDGWPNGMDPSACTCKEQHRHHPLLRRMDPRQDPHIDCDSLSRREQALRLLKFHRSCVSNFLGRFKSDNLGLEETRMIDFDWTLELKEFNDPLYNLMQNLLFIGWAEQELSCSSCAPGTFSPYRYTFLQGRDANEHWDGGHRETFTVMLVSFLESHKPSKDERAVVRWPINLTLSQLQHIPETIRRCIDNSKDDEAERLLGPDIASSIDLYRTARKTPIPVLEWMPCLGGDEETYIPLASSDGYQPRDGHIIGTALSVHPS